VRNRIENCFLEMVAKLNHLFVMATGTEPATTTAKSQKILVMAVRAFDPCEALMQIAAFKILSHHMRNYRAVKSKFFLEEFVVDLIKCTKMTIEELPE